MKKINLIVAAVLATTVVSCEKEPLFDSAPETNPEDGLVTLTLSTGEKTKTYIAENGTDVYWHPSDVIKVFTNVALTGENGYSYDFTMPEGFVPEGNFAKFEGKVALTTSTVWAVYPSVSAKNATTSGVLQVNLPSSQTAYNGQTGSFDQNMNISVAKAAVDLEYEFGDILTLRPVAAENLKFYNVGSLLKFHVPAGVGNIQSVTISADNNIAGDMTFDYSGNALVYGGITANGSNSITMTGTFTDNKDYYFVLAPVAISELSIFVNTTDNKQYAATRTFDEPMQLVAGQYKSLGTLNIANMTSFGVGFDIQDDGGFLNGTDVIFTFPSDNVSNLNLTVSNGTTVVRSIKVDGAVTLNESNQYISGCAGETVSMWPYLPKGTYTVSGTYETEGGVASVSGMTFEVDTDPDFSVGGYDAYTSWTLFKGGKVDEANSCNGSYIYFTIDQSAVTISEKILKNAKYNDIISVSFTKSADEIATGVFNGGVSSVLVAPVSGAYSTPTYHFDKVDKAFTNMTCNVTGIPHTANPPTKALGWTTPSSTDVVVWNDDGVQLWGAVSEPVIASPKVYLPEATKVALNVKASLYSFAALGVKSTANMVVRYNGVNLIEQAGENVTGFLATGSKTVDKTPSYNGTLSNGTYSIEMLNTNRAATSVTVKEYQLKYSK